MAVHAMAWDLSEHPAATGEWGYRPMNGATASINPPPFTWRPENNAVAYNLEVAADADFAALVHVVEKTRWSAHCPDKPLPHGRYFWRYRAWNETGAPSNWSSVRRFDVPDGLTIYPMPPLSELLKRIPAEHPRLFFRPEQVAHLRELAGDALADQWQKLLERANALLANPPDTSEPPKYPEGTEHKGEQWRKIWWGNRVHAINVTDAAATLAFVYRLTGEDNYGAAARDLIMAFCEWDPKGSTNYTYNDEAAMPLLYYPSRAYTWAYDAFSPEDRNRIKEVMAVRGTDCFNHLRNHLWRPYGSHSNRAWHWLGEVATAFYDEIADAPAWLEFSMTVFYTCYPVWGGADGGWHEGQAYWSSYLSRFMYWAMVMDSIYGINAFDKPFFKKAGDFGMYTCPPRTKTGAFGDQAILSDSMRIASFMGLMAAAANNPHWQWYAEQHGDVGPGGYFGFLVSAQGRGCVAQPPAALPSSCVFGDVGLAVLNTNLLDGTDNIQVHFKSSPYGRQSHGYNANNAFLLNLRGERALIRSGRRDIHGSPHHQKWMWETKSDNAILVNGAGQYPHTHQALGKITHFYTSEELDVVTGEAGESYRHLERWTRRILFFKPDVILIHDVLTASEPSTYQWLLHAQTPFTLGNRDISWKGAQGRLDIHFLKPASLVFSQTDEFDVPPHKWAFSLEEWHFTAATQKPETKMDFVTLIRVDNTTVQTAIEENDSGGTTVSLARPDENMTVYLGEHEFRVNTRATSKTFTAP